MFPLMGAVGIGGGRYSGREPSSGWLVFVPLDALRDGRSASMAQSRRAAAPRHLVSSPDAAWSGGADWRGMSNVRRTWRARRRGNGEGRMPELRGETPRGHDTQPVRLNVVRSPNLDRASAHRGPASARRDRGGTPRIHDIQPIGLSFPAFAAHFGRLRDRLETDQLLPAQPEQEEGVARIRATNLDEKLERVAGIEPATFSLGS